MTESLVVSMVRRAEGRSVLSRSRAGVSRAYREPDRFLLRLRRKILRDRLVAVIGSSHRVGATWLYRMLREAGRLDFGQANSQLPFQASRSLLLCHSDDPLAASSLHQLPTRGGRPWGAYCPITSVRLYQHAGNVVNLLIPRDEPRRLESKREFWLGLDALAGGWTMLARIQLHLQTIHGGIRFQSHQALAAGNQPVVQQRSRLSRVLVGGAC